MNVRIIYKKYKIPPNFQEHQLRVASLASLLVKNWKYKNLDRKSIILANLFHDMANIIKFNFSEPLLFNFRENQLEYWKKAQQEVIKKYGSNIHLATLKINRELGLPTKVLKIVEKLEWKNTSKILEEKDFGVALSIYSDMRIGPFGILSLQERLANLQTRNKSIDMHFIQKSASLLEKTLQENIFKDINSITNKQINSRFAKLLKLEV